jgi:L-rhamnose mutarotase
LPVFALHTVLKSGREPEYVAVHETIPAGVAAALRTHGVHDWRIWRDGRHVFHLVDVDDYAAMREGLRDLPDNVAWQETVGPMFDVPDSYAGGDDGIAFLWSLAGQLGGEEGWLFPRVPGDSDGYQGKHPPTSDSFPGYPAKLPPDGEGN